MTDALLPERVRRPRAVRRDVVPADRSASGSRSAWRARWTRCRRSTTRSSRAPKRRSRTATSSRSTTCPTTRERLLQLLYSLVMVSFPVEAWRQPHVPDSGAAYLDLLDRAAPVSDDQPIVLRADRWVDIDAGEVRSPAVIVVEGDRIAAVNPRRAAERRDRDRPRRRHAAARAHGHGAQHAAGRARAAGTRAATCRTTPRSARCAARSNCRTTLLAGFTTVRNLGLFVKTGGYLLDVALARAIDNGWIDGPRLVPAGHAITPTGGHLDPTMFQRLGARHHAAERRGGHRERRARGAQGGPLPDQVRRASSSRSPRRAA